MRLLRPARAAEAKACLLLAGLRDRGQHVAGSTAPQACRAVAHVTACTACSAQLPAIVGARFCCWCGSALDGESALQAKRDELAAWCAARGHWMSADARVYEPVAALVLGVVDGTLRNWRSQSVGGEVIGPAFHRTGGRRGRITYALIDLARHLLQHAK